MVARENEHGLVVSAQMPSTPWYEQSGLVQQNTLLPAVWQPSAPATVVVDTPVPHAAAVRHVPISPLASVHGPPGGDGVGTAGGGVGRGVGRGVDTAPPDAQHVTPDGYG